VHNRNEYETDEKLITKDL